MRIHILGVCGTFMAGVAAIARELGHEVTGSDTAFYPPMSEQLRALGIAVREGYREEHLRELEPDLVLIGNALSRGNPAVEAVLDRGLPYASGPEWLARELLHQRKVIAIAGTHGKTTTTALTAFLLDRLGLAPGFLIGGVARDFPLSARVGSGELFVIEADEYDTAFFDKRAKFLHYRPRIAVLNNLEYDHADIYPDLASIERQFHLLVRTVPRSGRLVVKAGDEALERVLQMGCWTPVERFGFADGARWRAEALCADASRFRVWHDGRELGKASWALAGVHNVENALAALAAVSAAGVMAEAALGHLPDFRGVRRRLEFLGEVGGIRVFEDFAHHPTAIARTLEALRARLGPGSSLRLALEPRSNSMRMGAHLERLPEALALADRIELFIPPGVAWRGEVLAARLGERLRVHSEIEGLIEAIARDRLPGEAVCFMSNGSFGGAPQRLLSRLGQATLADEAG
ncbi:MAG: UDP-N-acetylmuramate--L-alanyl-gamma-D-glutamyl-meso-2,6-diaminoheptandioate ligase [Lysobacterales bacterium]|jgi:UDP-N-acetylmuramate: L-alanyl-gamma-D-glutamyl-meso-diaminopimelate ligase|nr:MAG: UDP-N-acetylmuramate--L-alanyl-gamma-D-glutamyl-meso-2,6-diaminoheptandioate ligase [Xanthomonadales bacterium]